MTSSSVGTDELTLLGSFIGKTGPRSKRQGKSRERQIFEKTLKSLEVIETNDEIIRTILEDIEDQSFFGDLINNTPHYPSQYKTTLRCYWRDTKRFAVQCTEYVLQNAKAWYESPKQQARKYARNIRRYQGRWIWASLLALYALTKFTSHTSPSDHYVAAEKRVQVTASDSLAMRTYHDDPLETMKTIQQYASANLQQLPNSRTTDSKNVQPFVDSQNSFDSETNARLPESQQQNDPAFTINTAKLAVKTSSSKIHTPIVQQNAPQRVESENPTMLKSILGDYKIDETTQQEEQPSVERPSTIDTFQEGKQSEENPTLQMIPTNSYKQELLPRNTIQEYLTRETNSDNSVSYKNQVPTESANEKYSTSLTETDAKKFNRTDTNRLEVLEVDLGIVEIRNRTELENSTKTQQMHEVWRPRHQGESKIPPAIPEDQLHPRYRPLSADEFSKGGL